MDHQDLINLIKKGVEPQDGVWANVGSGSGAFTLALADLLLPAAHIYSVDKDRQAMQRQQQTMDRRFPNASVTYLQADYTRPMTLPLLDGLLLANKLHFHLPSKRPALLQQLRTYLKPMGRLIIIEYNTRNGTRWVPHPFTFDEWQQMATNAGFTQTTMLATHPSHFLREIFSAVSLLN